MNSKCNVRFLMKTVCSVHLCTDVNRTCGGTEIKKSFSKVSGSVSTVSIEAGGGLSCTSFFWKILFWLSTQSAAEL